MYPPPQVSVGSGLLCAREDPPLGGAVPVVTLSARGCGQGPGASPRQDSPRTTSQSDGLSQALKPGPSDSGQLWALHHQAPHLPVHPEKRGHGLQPTRLLRPWDVPGKSTGVKDTIGRQIFINQGVRGET